jgi:phosphatidyl-myo-inositol alpha-mannosyltransferase
MYHALLPQEGRKPGGVEVFVHRLANALTDRGHAVTVVAYQQPGWPARYASRMIGPRKAVTSSFVRQYVASWLMTARPFDGRYDIAHLHGDDWFYLRRKLPTMRTYHGSALLEGLTATSYKRRLNQSLIFLLELWARGRADAVYGVGSDSCAIYRADGILRIGVDPNPVAREPSTHPSILFVGTWEGRKRGALLHRTFQEYVRPRIPQAELWMVCDRAEPGPGATWLGSPDEETLSRLMSQAWAFCLPSRYEGLGIPYLEAMASGVPVVSTPNPGSSDVLAGGAGVLAEDHRLGEALVQLLTDSDQRVSLERAGRRRAQEDFSWDRVIDDYEAAYAMAIERWQRRQLA